MFARKNNVILFLYLTIPILSTGRSEVEARVREESDGGGVYQAEDRYGIAFSF